jgi:hypothetical protein
MRLSRSNEVASDAEERGIGDMIMWQVSLPGESTSAYILGSGSEDLDGKGSAGIHEPLETEIDSREPESKALVHIEVLDPTVAEGSKDEGRGRNELWDSTYSDVW